MIDLIDMHTHTTASGHAYNTLYELAYSAAQRGLALLGCSDHAPAMPGSCHYYHFLNFKVIPRTICGVKIMMGVELNIIDYEGAIDMEQNLLESLDYSIASLHTPCIQCGSMLQNTNAYLNAIKNPAIHIIGHPDDGRFPIDYDTLVAAAKEHHTLLEVNSSSLSPLSFRQGARENYKIMLKLCRQYGASIIINSDDHSEADVGNHRRVHELLEEVQFPERLVVNTSLDRLAEYIPFVKAIIAQAEDERCGQADASLKGYGGAMP